MRLNFFFDIDGTLLPFGKRVPDSALEAIKSAKESGDRIFLSTGRSIAEISDEIASLPLNGGVYSAGGRAYADGKLLYKRVFTPEERREALNAIEKFNLEGVIQTDEGTYFKKESLELFKNLMMEYVGNVIEIPHAAVVDELSEELEMNKFLIISKERRVQEVREALKGKFVVVDNRRSSTTHLRCSCYLISCRSNRTNTVTINRMLQISNVRFLFNFLAFRVLYFIHP